MSEKIEANKKEFATLEWKKDTLIILDQRYLPNKVIYENIHTVKGVYEAIKKLKIRGAPAIGVIAAFGLYIGSMEVSLANRDELMSNLEKDCKYLISSRPTAVNLSWAINKVYNEVIGSNISDVDELRREILKIALKITADEEIVCDKLGEYGASLIWDGMRILTHCNTGKLATTGLGTALAAIYSADYQGKSVKVYIDETRPVLQGSRLTAFELLSSGIDSVLICDNMAASLMAKGMIDMVIVGADRVAANGDVCNKIGTYQLACLARMHNIPFYVSCPLSTIDMTSQSGIDIIIEEREPEEVTHIQGVEIAPTGINVYNPAFDVTPCRLVSGIITEKGILKAPYTESIEKVFEIK